jgi:hypothetical protein
MLGFGSVQAAGLSELIAKKRYPRAIEVLREQLKSRRRDPRVRRQLADVLAMAGRPKEAVPILLELAEDLALSGAAGKAIAILKRAQRLEPGQREVDEQLAYLINQQKTPSPDPWAQARTADSAPPPPRFDDLGGATPPYLGDLEEIPAEDQPPRIPSAATRSEAAPPAPPPLGLEEEALPLPSPPPPSEAAGDLLPMEEKKASPSEPATGPDAGGTAPAPEEFPRPEEDGPEANEEAFRDEVLGLIEDVMSGRRAPESSTMTSLPVVQTPLFPDFSADELVEVIRGLELRAYEPGEILVTEGEPGESLFVLTTGAVRTYVRDAQGASAPVRVLREGDFFGEVSLLEGSPRTATVTAAGHCELLEIDRLTLGRIAHKHPRVWSVVREFSERRARSEAELAARAGQAAPKGAREP